MIIAVYVDDLNLIRSPEEIINISINLTKEIKIKDLGKTKFCLSLQIEHLEDEILLHQSTYTQKVLKKFNMDHCHPLSTHMVVDHLT